MCPFNCFNSMHVFARMSQWSWWNLQRLAITLGALHRHGPSNIIAHNPMRLSATRNGQASSFCSRTMTSASAIPLAAAAGSSSHRRRYLPGRRNSCWCWCCWCWWLWLVRSTQQWPSDATDHRPDGHSSFSAALSLTLHLSVSLSTPDTASLHPLHDRLLCRRRHSRHRHRCRRRSSLLQSSSNRFWPVSNRINPVGNTASSSLILSYCLMRACVCAL